MTEQDPQLNLDDVNAQPAQTTAPETPAADDGQEQPQEKAVPEVVQQYFPALADFWADLPSDKQAAVLADLASHLAESEAAEAEAGNKGQDRPKEAEARPTGKTEQAAAGLLEKAPPVISEEARAKVLNYFTDDPEIRDAFKQAFDAVDWAGQVGRHTLGAIQEFGRSVDDVVLPLRQERELEEALVKYNADHANRLSDLPEADYATVTRAAAAWKKSNPGASFEDAIDLALARSGKVAGADAGKAERTRRALLASGATGQARRPSVPGHKPAQTLDEAADMAIREVAKS